MSDVSSTPGSELLVAADVRKRFGAQRVLDGVALRVERGSAYGLVGRNGAGKTTFIRVLLGLLRADQGVVNVGGFDPWQHQPRMYRRMGVVLEHDGFWGSLTYLQSMRVFAQARGLRERDLEDYLHDYWDDTEIVHSGKRAKHFSRGQRMQAALSRAFLGWPDVVLLDEPTVGLDVDSYEHFHAMVREARSRGAAVLISSHQLEAVQDLCDRVGMLEQGVLTELVVSTSDEWLVRWKGDVGASVFELDGITVAERGDGSCRFVPGDARVDVPALVSRLVEAGAAVLEVCRAGTGLRELMRGGAARRQGDGQ